MRTGLLVLASSLEFRRVRGGRRVPRRDSREGIRAGENATPGCGRVRCVCAQGDAPGDRWKAATAPSFEYRLIVAIAA